MQLLPNLETKKIPNLYHQLCFFFKPNFNFHETQACNETDFDPQTSKFNASDTRPTPTSGLSKFMKPNSHKEEKDVIDQNSKELLFQAIIIFNMQ